jgi:hypothetical protein
MKEEVLRFLTGNAGLYYCRICLSKHLRVSHDELRSVLPTIGLLAPGIVSRQGPCVECRNSRTVFAYKPPRPS